MTKPSKPQQSNKASPPFASAERARRASESGETVTVLSNTVTNNDNSIQNNSHEIKILRFGVDSLYLSYQGNLHPEIDLKLNQLKKLAQSDRPEQQAKAQFAIGEHLFEVKDKGASIYSYVLEDNAFRIQLSRPNKAVPMAYIKISSEYLCHKSPKDTEKALHQLLTQLGILDSSANVSRIDLFVDFVSPQNMEWDRQTWVTRAHSINGYTINNHFTGWMIGQGGVISARLYDKLYEIISSNKGYLMPLWQAAGWQEDEPIWRLEFQYRRDFLKQKNIIALSEVLNHLNGLWSYATTEWLKLTLPNGNDSKRDRWPIHPMWQALSTIDWETSGGALQARFQHHRCPDKHVALHRAFTAVTTWMAVEGYSDYELAIHPFFLELDGFINNHAINLGTDFNQLIREKVGIKARAFNSINVNEEIYAQYVNDEVAAYRKASDGE